MVGTNSVYYLVARSYTESSAGVRAMHILCDRLNQFGQEAFLVPVDKEFSTRPNLHTPILTKNLRNLHYKEKKIGISIQDESIIGNPLNSDINIRWILNYVGSVAGAAGESSHKDFVYTKEISEFLPRLYVNTVDYLFFESAAWKSHRDVSLFYAGKLRSQGVELQVPAGAIEIHREGKLKQTREELRKLFSRAKLLYLAEDSAIALEAAICGCPTVRLEKYFQNPPLSTEDGEIGIAQSDSPSDLKNAIVKATDMKRYIAKLELRTNHDVAKFILETQAMLNNKPIRKIRYSVKKFTIIQMRAGKLFAAYKKTRVKGLYGIFVSHQNQNKAREI
jgi:hypothetical protein